MPEPVRGHPSATGQHQLDRLIEVVALLRERCPWMGGLTHASLVEYLVEESYELVDAIEDVAVIHPDASGEETANRLTELRGELGDVLLQVVLHAQLQREQGHFDLISVIEGLTEKMIRRNPHVFAGDGSLAETPPGSLESIIETWHQVKRAEDPQRSDPFHGIPRHLPALALAAKTVRRAPGSSESPAVPPPRTEAELGEKLLAMVHESVVAGLDPERALRSAVLSYQERSRSALTADTNGGKKS